METGLGYIFVYILETCSCQKCGKEEKKNLVNRTSARSANTNRKLLILLCYLQGLQVHFIIHSNNKSQMLLS